MSADEKAPAKARKKKKKPAADVPPAAVAPSSPPVGPGIGQSDAEIRMLLDHHRWIALGATVAIFGLALVGIGYHEGPDGEQLAGELDQRHSAIALVLVGLILLMYRIHRYGRLGSGARETARGRGAQTHPPI